MATVWLLTVQKLIAVAWVIADPALATYDSFHRVHARDRCWLEGGNRLFDAGQHVAYAAEVGDRKTVCGSHAE